MDLIKTALSKVPLPPSFKNPILSLFDKYLKDYVLPLKDVKIHQPGYFFVTHDVTFKLEKLNKFLQKINFPIEFHLCTLGHLRLSKSYVFEVDDLHLVGQIKREFVPNFDSGSFHKDPQFEEIFTKNNLFDFGTNTLESFIPLFEVHISNVHVEIESIPINAKNGISLHLQIKEIDIRRLKSQELFNINKDDSHPAEISSAENITIEGISLLTSEFVDDEASTKETDEQLCSPEEPLEDLEVDKDTFHSTVADDLNSKKHQIEFLRFYGKQEIYRYTYLKGESSKSKPKDSESPTSSVPSDIASVSAREDTEDFIRIVPSSAISATLTSFAVFLTPRQAHLLIEFSNAISDSFTKSGETFQQRDMTKSDVEIAMMEMASQSQIFPNGMLGMESGWSGPKAGSSIAGDSRKHSMVDSIISNYSFYSSYEEADEDENANTVHFNIKMDRMIAILFHEEFLRCSNAVGEVLLEATITQMQNMSEMFFDEVASMITNLNCDIRNNSFYINICKGDHLRLTMNSLCCQNGEDVDYLKTFSVSNFELSECLNYNRTNEPINDFILIKSLEANHVDALTVVCDNYKEICDHQVIAKTAIDINFEVPLFIELDITIAERLSALLNPWPLHASKDFINSASATANMWTAVPTNPLDYETDLQVKVSHIHCKLRFPIPDFRPCENPQRNPSWKRNLRTDFLLLDIEDVKGYSRLFSKDTEQKYILQWSKCEVRYAEKENIDTILLGSINTKSEECKQPEIRVCVYPKDELPSEIYTNKMANSMMQSVIGYSDDMPEVHGPFSAAHIVYQSNIMHEEPDNLPKLVLPGDKSEMMNFIEDTLENSHIVIKFNIPFISAQLISKHFYEVIYNRIMNDLLLWKPYSSIMKASLDPKLDCEGLRDEDELFYSLYSSTNSKIKLFPKNTLVTTKDNKSFLSIDFKMESCMLSMVVPARNSSGKVIPNNFGEFLFNLKDIEIFSVTSYDGNENLDFIAIQALEGQMYHCDVTSDIPVNRPLRNINDTIPHHLLPTIYKTRPEDIESFKDRTRGRDMISVAVRVELDPEIPTAKMITASLGLSKAVLNYKMYKGPNHWVSQLIDFFSVLDQPIDGYQPKSVTSQLHFHIWNSTIDYRPLFIPWYAVLHMGYLTFSSQVLESSGANMSRFLSEDCFLYMGKRKETTKVSFKLPLIEGFDLKNDYVQLLHVTMFEICLKTLENSTKEEPCYDLRVTNDMAHMTVTADSFQALTELVKYIANYGDIPEYQNSLENSFAYSDEDSKLLSNCDEDEKLKYVHEYVNMKMEEAINEEFPQVKPSDTPTPDTSGTKLFYFKDETQLVEDENMIVLSQVTTELGTPWTCDTDTDEEYCVIGLDDSELSHFPRSTDPEINWLSDKPLIIKQNFFVPSKEPVDIFKAPPNTPVPLKRYTACNMNILVSIYGGDDFKLLKSTTSKELVRFDDISLSQDNTRNIPKSKGKRKTKKSKERFTGGPNRDYAKLVDFSFTKIKYLLDIYPNDARVASRHVLGIQDVEIIDFVESSDIKMFLYRHCTEMRPKTDAPMVLIKNTYLKPDIKLNTQECSLKIAIAPIRLNMDQDTLDFMVEYFTNAFNDEADEITSSSSSRHSTPTHVMPVISVNMEKLDQCYDEKRAEAEAQKIVEENLLILLGDDFTPRKDEGTQSETTTQSETESTKCGNPDTFIKRLNISEIYIRLDFQGKGLNLSRGPLHGIIIGLAQLKRVEFTLGRIYCERGLRGFNKAFKFCAKVWTDDIKSRQYPNVLSGISVLDCFFKLMKGARDFVYLPIQQYQKDGRIIRGLQRGAHSFTTSTIFASLQILARFLDGLQICAEHIFIMISPNPSVSKRLKHKAYRKPHQPNDLREGVVNAINVLQLGLNDTAQNFIKITCQEHEEKGYTGAVGGVLRQIPAIMVDPILITTEAASNVLDGIQNALQPELRNEAKQKYKDEDDR